LGRAPGTDQMTAMELRNGRYESVNDFPENILKLQTYFSKENHTSKVRAIPGEGQDIPIWILGSSTDSAQLAGYLGLPYAFATHFAPAQFYAAIEIYKQTFRPSDHLKKPYIMACVNVIAADSDKEANKLATSLYQMFIGIITGRRTRLQAPVENMDELWSDYEKEAAKQMLEFSFIGNKETLKKGLKEFLKKSGINELMAISNIYSQEAKLHSYQLLADVMNEI
ncbi:MAG: MsnO8 family LLM class oxidoreductase, partial [Ginsengibacter sp.]